MPPATDDKAIYFRFGTELIDNWEDTFDKVLDRAQKTQAEFDRRRFRLPKPDTEGWDKAFRDGAKYMATLDAERDRAEERAARDRARRQAQMTRDAQRELAARTKAEEAAAKDSEKLSSDLAGAWRKHNEEQTRLAEKAAADSSKAWDRNTAAIAGAMSRITYASFDLAKGLAYIGAASEEDAEDIVRLIVKVEGVIAVTRSLTTVVIAGADAWKAYRAAREAATAVKAVGGAASSAAGGLMPALAGAAVSNPAVAIGVAGAAAATAAIVGTLWWFDDNFRNGAKSFIGSLTDADKQLLGKLNQAATLDAERGSAFNPERRAMDRERLTAREQLLSDRAAIDVYRDKSIAPADKGLAYASRSSDLAIAAARGNYDAARHASSDLAQRIDANPADVSWQERLDVAERLKAAEDHLVDLERQRLDITRQTQQQAVDGMNKQLDASKKLFDQQKAAADEADRVAADESNKYRTDLERFGQADVTEQIKLRAIKQKLDNGQSLNADESRLAAGYSTFAEAARNQDRQRALAAGGSALFGEQGSRAFQAAIAADEARGLATGTQERVARLENEITIKLDTDVQELAQRLEENIRPIAERVVETLETVLNNRLSERDSRERNLRVKQDIQGG